MVRAPWGSQQQQTGIQTARAVPEKRLAVKTPPRSQGASPFQRSWESCPLPVRPAIHQRGRRPHGQRGSRQWPMLTIIRKVGDKPRISRAPLRGQSPQKEKWSFSPQNSPLMKSTDHSGVRLQSYLIHTLADCACTVQAYWPQMFWVKQVCDCTAK